MAKFILLPPNPIKPTTQLATSLGPHYVEHYECLEQLNYKLPAWQVILILHEGLNLWGHKVL